MVRFLHITVQAGRSQYRKAITDTIILLNPKGGKSVIKIKNNSNDMGEQVIHETIFGLTDPRRDSGAYPRAMILGFSFTAEYATSAKPMMVDNIVTNIVKAVN